MEKCKNGGYGFSIGDIIVRCYASGRESICIYYRCKSLYNVSVGEYVIYLDESFIVDGGMQQFHSYGYYGVNSYYTYRLCTMFEVERTIIKLREYRRLYGNIGIGYFCDLDNLITIVCRNISGIRREKLERISRRL